MIGLKLLKAYTSPDHLSKTHAFKDLKDYNDFNDFDDFDDCYDFNDGCLTGTISGSVGGWELNWRGRRQAITPMLARS